MLHWLTGTIHELGYAGVALLMFLENIVLPLPAEVIMPMAGFVAARGRLAFPLVLACGFAGEFAGALPWYVLGRSMARGRAQGWLERHGRWLLLRRSELERAQRWFEGKGRVSVLLARLLPGVHPLIGVPAGMAAMPLLPFLLYSAAGIALWVGGLGWGGYLLGAHFSQVSRYMRPVGWGAGAALALGAGAWAYRRRRRSRR